MEPQHGALAALDLLDLVGVDQEGEGGAVGAGGRLDHVRHVALAGLLVEVLELLAANLACWVRSKSPRLAIPSSSDQPIGNRYSMSLVADE